MAGGVTVALLGSKEVGRELAKKGTESDLTLYNLVRAEHAVTLVEPTQFPEKFAPLLYALSMADRTLVFLSTLSREVAEILATADQFEAPTTFVLGPDIGEEELRRALKGTTLANAPAVRFDLPKLRDTLEGWTSPSRPGPARVRIDHAYPVKGVGAVALGIVTQGTLKAHDRLRLYPTAHSVEVRSIQVHDVEVREAESGSRVGLALKGVEAEELARGQTLAAEGTLTVADQVETFDFRPCPYYAGSLEVGSHVHALVGLQFVPAKVTSRSDDTLVVHLDREVVFGSPDRLVVADLSVTRGPRVAGHGTIGRR